MGTQSIWRLPEGRSHRCPLSENLKTQVCVIGAGISGLSTAYLLASQGKSVIILEKGEIGSGETGRTTAHLSNVLDDRFEELERIHGEGGSQLALESHTAAIHLIEEIVRREEIDCHFQRLNGYLFQPDLSRDVLEKEWAAAKRAGFSDCELLTNPSIQGLNLGFAIRFLNQGQFHPLLYLNGLANAILRLGGSIYTKTQVNKYRARRACACRDVRGK